MLKIQKPGNKSNYLENVYTFWCLYKHQKKKKPTKPQRIESYDKELGIGVGAVDYFFWSCFISKLCKCITLIKNNYFYFTSSKAHLLYDLFYKVTE